MIHLYQDYYQYSLIIQNVFSSVQNTECWKEVDRQVTIFREIGMQSVRK